ncbi:MAG: hypothetical protein CL693_16450 [Cellvibrionaceae bacterium]|nr:hypothetical protein [Cellvibrionaceae bacterium]
MSHTKSQKMEEILELAANALGDITSLVLREFYQRCPEAKEMFSNLSYGNSTNLEASMVDAALYCMMNWIDRPLDVTSKLENAVPLHDYWNVPVEYCVKFQRAVFDVIKRAIEDQELHEFLGEIQQELVSTIENVSKVES